MTDVGIPQAKERSGPICIIGMHRSGTSMVARLLNLCGLNLGSPELLMDPNEANSSGYFEHKGFLKVNEALLAHFGGSWTDPPRLTKGWEHDPALDTLVHEAKTLINTFSETSLWGWKEPRTTVLLPFWKLLLPNLRFVICVRSPLEVARSLEKRDNIPIGAGVHLWGQYMRAAIEDTEGCSRIFTFYEDYFNDLLGEAHKVVKCCGLQKPEDLSAIQDAVPSELRHHKSENFDLLVDRNAPSEQRLFYLCLRAVLNQRFGSVLMKPRSNDGTLGSVNVLLHLFDEFHDQETFAQLQKRVAEKEQQLSNARLGLKKNLAQKEYEISQLRDVIAQLQEQNDKLQTFADAVRGTLASRGYRKFVQPRLPT
jgi:hypothetical protein